jgi:hypothetical protein
MNTLTPTGTAPFAQGIGHPCIALFPFGHDLYGIIVTYRLADPAAGADVLIHTGNRRLGLVGVFGKDGTRPAHGSACLGDGIIDKFRGMACAWHEYPFGGKIHRPKFHIL